MLVPTYFACHGSGSTTFDINPYIVVGHHALPPTAELRKKSGIFNNILKINVIQIRFENSK